MFFDRSPLKTNKKEIYESSKKQKQQQLENKMQTHKQI